MPRNQREWLKKSSCPESCRRKDLSDLGARSVLLVREHGKMATCLREAAFSLRSHFGEGGPAACAPKLASAASAEAGNAGGGFFQHSHASKKSVNPFRFPSDSPKIKKDKGPWSQKQHPKRCPPFEGGDLPNHKEGYRVTILLRVLSNDVCHGPIRAQPSWT